MTLDFSLVYLRSSFEVNVLIMWVASVKDFRGQFQAEHLFAECNLPPLHCKLTTTLCFNALYIPFPLLIYSFISYPDVELLLIL